MKAVRVWSTLVGLAAVLGGTVPAIAQAPSVLLAQAEDRPAFNFETNPNLCGGQIVNGGNVCITNDPASQTGGRRSAMMLYLKNIAADNPFFLLAEDPSTMVNSVTFTVVQVTELAPNESNLLYAAVVDERTLSTQGEADQVDRPLLMVGIRSDEVVGINANYGQFSPYVAPNRTEMANHLLAKHQAAIQQLINTLNQTR